MNDYQENTPGGRQQDDTVAVAKENNESCRANSGPQEAGFEFHEFANIFPLLDAEKLGELARDIRDHGLRDPVVLHGGKILDGRSRYLACQRVGIEPTIVEFAGGDALALVLSRNLHRRQMNESQRAMVAAKIANLPVGANQHSGGLPIGIASKLLNVSPRSTARAKEVLISGDSNLIKAVEAGDVAVSTAAASVTALTKAADATAGQLFGDKTDGTVSPSNAPEPASELGARSELDRVAHRGTHEKPRLDNILAPGITVLVGDMSSVLLPMAVKIAATEMAGDYWPDNSKATAGEVAWLTIQRGAAQMIRAQCEAAGAHVQRLHFLDPIHDDFGLPVRHFAEDLRRLARDLPSGVTCVVIDYLSEYFHAGTPIQSVLLGLNKAMAFMNAIASEKRIAIIAVCQIPGRDDRHIVEATKQIESLPNVKAVLRVVRAEKPNRGRLMLSGKDNEQQFAFQLRQRNGESVIVWEAVSASCSTGSPFGDGNHDR